MRAEAIVWLQVCIHYWDTRRLFDSNEWQILHETSARSESVHDVKDELKSLWEENFELKRSLDFTLEELDGVKRKCDELSTQEISTVGSEDVRDWNKLLKKKVC